MGKDYLHSVKLVLNVTKTATLPATTGHQAHALFLSLIHQVDASLATRLHEELGYRPFTVSPLLGGKRQQQCIVLHAGQTCSLRVTLLDGGYLWRCLNERFLEEGNPLIVRLGAAEFKVERLLTTPMTDPDGWTGFTDWHTLAATPAHRLVTLRFASPTAFSLGKRQFSLMPDPALVWDSLTRVWNTYTPDPLRMDRMDMRAFVESHVTVKNACTQTDVIFFPSHPQRGFIGTCTYQIRAGKYSSQLASLAEFARYAGVGSKMRHGLPSTTL